jgi:nucleotide-binding universal stress UspA family protein
MFTHLLLPTDGTPLSEAAVRRGLALAREQQARVTAIHVVPEFHVLSYRTERIGDTRDEFLAHCRESSQKYLAAVESAAREEGVPCSTVAVTSDHPYEAIIRTAESARCDLIVMASHGRRGLQGLVIGSETHKVLTHTKVPVLVLR